MKKIIAIWLLTFFSTHSFAQEQTESGADYALQLMSLGKLTGNCGIFRAQVVFQEETVLDNGDEFLSRYWTMEAARLGKTLEEYVQYCLTYMNEYTEQYELIESQIGSEKLR